MGTENHLKLRDIVTIKPDTRFKDMSKPDRVQFMDSILSGDEKKRGLVVRFDLSHSGRRINNRIYTTWGQRDGITSLTEPYRKKILRHHDTSGEPIGSFLGGIYVDTTQDAARHLTKVNDMILMQKGFEDRDYQVLSDSLHRSGVLMNPKWPGLGKMHVAARITDQDAVEKFLDGRYDTFSAGSSTDHAYCSVCLNDWGKGKRCEHSPGEIVDGKAMVLMCGAFSIREASVVNEPADDLSSVISIELTDSVGDIGNPIMVDREILYITDSLLSAMEDTLNTDEKVPEVEPVVETVADTVVETPEPIVEVVDAAPIEKAEEKEESPDWFLLDLAYMEKLGERRISMDIRKRLPDSAFACGDKRAMPIFEAEHYEAAKAVIMGSDMSDDLKAKTLAYALRLKPTAPTVELDKYNSLNEDYGNALRQIDTLKVQLGSVLDMVAKQHNKVFELLEDRSPLTVMFDWFESLAKVESPTITPVEDPSIAGTPALKDNKLKTMDPFEQDTISAYKRLLNDRGEAAADLWFLTKKAKYLPKTFHPRNF